MIPNQLKSSTSENATGLGFRKQLRAIKDGLPIEDLAREHGEFKSSGAGKLIGRCIAPDHEDKSPSMVLYLEDQRFWCFGCQRGGDLLDLAQLTDPTAETWELLVDLSIRFSVELPSGRPPSWFAKQERQKPIRDALERIRVERAQRRLYRWMCAPSIAQFEDEYERRQEEGIAWQECELVARQVAKGAGEGVEHGA